MTENNSNTEAIINAVLDVLEDHDVLVGSSISTLKDLRQELTDAINNAITSRISSNGIGIPVLEATELLQEKVAPPILISDETNKAIDEIDASIVRSTIDGPHMLIEQAATFTHDGEVCDCYYFAPANRTEPPYLKQVHADAILDIASDGTLAGVELILDGVPPPPQHKA